jgi:hypothetical protein
MEDSLVRAQHYLELALKMHKTAEMEPDKDRQAALLGLAEQYETLAEKLFKAQQDNALVGGPSPDPAPA